MQFMKGIPDSRGRGSKCCHGNKNLCFFVKLVTAFHSVWSSCKIHVLSYQKQKEEKLLSMGKPLFWFMSCTTRKMYMAHANNRDECILISLYFPNKDTLGLIACSCKQGWKTGQIASLLIWIFDFHIFH